MTICDVCDYAAPSIRCGQHPLNTGVVRELHQSMLGGQGWGNIIYDQDEEVLENMSAAEKAALETKKAKEEMERTKGLVDYTVNMRKKLYTGTDGVAKRKFTRMCKKERYEGGCYLHNEKHGSCSFVHKDERSRYDAIFAGLGMKMVDDVSYFAMLSKADKASGDVKWKMERECDAMEQSLKKEARCIFVTGVDATGELTFVKTNPEYSDTRSSQSGGSHPNSARSNSNNGFRGQQMQQQNHHQQQQNQQQAFWNKKTVDNGAW
jgi:hypothetical protein